MTTISHLIWYEKYRPTSINSMTLPDNLRHTFATYIKQQSFPHLLFSGPPGSGKSTITKILTTKVPCAVLELNASSKDRGIDVIKTKVTTFAGSKAFRNTLNVVILEEADYLTKDAQAALRNTIEKYSKNCRFIFTANYPDKIINAIHSRCKHFSFTQFSKKQLTILLGRILKAEKIRTTKKSVTDLIDRYYPDCRTIINELQNACINGVFDSKQLSISNITPEALIKVILSGNIYKLRQLIVNESDYTWMYRAMYDVLLPHYRKDMDKASDIVCIVAEHLNNDPMCPDKEINFISCVTQILLTLEIQLNF
jgi:DNA polymerase III delta prime subunit